MVVKSVLTVISVNKTKIAYIGAQKVLRNFGYKMRGNQFFKFGAGKEKGNQIFTKILGGNQSLTHYVYYR